MELPLPPLGYRLCTRAEACSVPHWRRAIKYVLPTHESLCTITGVWVGLSAYGQEWNGCRILYAVPDLAVAKKNIASASPHS